MAVAVCSAAVVLIAQNTLLWWLFPHLSRFTTDFSALYLQRELISMERAPARKTVFIGDSVLWGYHVNADQTAVWQLQRSGCDCENLSFKASSPPNYYALVKLMARYGISPKAVVIEVNQKVLSPGDNAYATLYPAVAVLASSAKFFTKADKAVLALGPEKRSNLSTLQEIANRYSFLYAMRTDVRETWYGDPADPLPPKIAPDPMMFDLTPLTSANVGVRYLEKTLDALVSARVPVLAFTTPTNHVLMHEYLDAPEYRSNDRFLVRDMERHGARVLDLDSTIPAREFIDATHLTTAGNAQLARILFNALSFEKSPAV